VIFTNDATKRYEDFAEADIASIDTNNGIKYENNEIMEDTVLLLRYNCPDGDCDVACLGWPDLHRHVRAIHHKKICDLCSRHKKVFTHEHELYTDKDLDRHMKRGDDNPGAIDQSGFKGHPDCGFCRLRFYGDDELYVHCREKHERCFLCDRREGIPPQYYLDYNALVGHFGRDHFPCLESTCLEKRFIVFPTEMDLKAHQLEEHGDTLSKDVRRDARVVDISSFDYRTPYIQERPRGSQREQREGRGRGRGRDPNSEPIPASSAQPLRRDEQAFQRQLAIHSAQSISNRTFGGQLTAAAAPAPTPAAARALASAGAPPSITVARPSAIANTPPPSSPLLEIPTDQSPQDQARQLRHRTVLERASILLQNDSSRMSQFRAHISSFQKNSITASALIDSFFTLFSDTAPDSLGTLIREVADLYEDINKSNSLRTAWSDWRAINEDYPSLPGPSISSGSIPLNWTTSSQNKSSAKSNRVLKLKSSTAASSRSSVSQNRSWGTANSSSSNTNNTTSSTSTPFPSLPPSSSNQTTNASRKITTIPWVPSNSNSNSNSAASSAPTSRPVSRGPPRGGTDMFPALPPAPKPQSTIFGYGRGMVRRDGLGGSSTPTGSAWDAGGESASTNKVEGGDGEGDSGAKGKKKGNKGKKQVLMNWG
jgi:hypothetical protein